MLQRLRRTIKRQEFQPGLLGILVNPFYIIRKGLYDAIAASAPSLSGRILDFGCGSKPYQSLFAHADEYIGLDIETSGHDHETSKVDVFYDGKTIPFPDGHFDAAVAFEVFEHVFTIDDTLRELNRVMRQGGTLLFTIPFVWDEHEKPYDFARYTSFGIESILVRNGFTDIKIKKTTTYYQAASQLMIAYVYQHLLIGSPFFRRILGMIIVFPMNLLVILLNKVLPKSYDCFCNMAISCVRAYPNTPALKEM